jgi:hypothetical protein
MRFFEIEFLAYGGYFVWLTKRKIQFDSNILKSAPNAPKIPNIDLWLLGAPFLKILFWSVLE